LINRSDRVTVWGAQLAANDFPPICAMTGRTAETWRKFSFATPPRWAYSLLILVCAGGVGLIAYAIVMAVTANRASGYLPLTRSTSRNVALAVWGPIVALGLFVLCWVLATIIGIATSDATSNAIAWIFFWFGAVLLLGGLLGRLLIKPLISPRARVTDIQPGTYDRLVELRNVNPIFVAAVRQIHATRAAQYSAIQSPPGIPRLPESI
jgi:hypothetical protein